MQLALFILGGGGGVGVGGVQIMSDKKFGEGFIIAASNQETSMNLKSVYLVIFCVLSEATFCFNL